ncbi:MAG TPA: sigma-70 family RNA polymerase sigma factor [Vicinamibacterales bacterium]|jgi:RNA polymerase sigma-70 factor (ECF subfamily)|nr:sigma-70 family RNA polymerase sigma factor [Vicinamibacterales bacterium]
MSQDDTTALLSDEPTVELIIRARRGDHSAVNAILQRCLPPLTRWAHGRLPAVARGALDTGDLVQDAAISAIARLDTFEPRHVGAMQAYLRQSVINRIRDEMRRVGRRPAAVELPPDVPSDDPSPLDQALEHESYERYRSALNGLKPRERELVIARVEAQWSLSEIADHFGFNSVDAARMAVRRAAERLGAALRDQQ